MNRILHERTITLRRELGPLRFVANDEALAALHFVDHHRAPPSIEAVSLDEGAHHDVIDAAIAEVEQYLAGTRTEFSIPLAPEGTEFQCDVWTALRAIPFGETRSYEDLARAIKKPRAVRAVGAANGRNPIGIVVPCHRVVGKDGSLTGYAGGVSKKAFLLALEAPQRVFVQ
jgi:methylated-DNA-[protein]-cysteine S-methyltransferase